MNPNFFDLARHKNRDILSELLSSKPQEGIISRKEIVAINTLIADIPAHCRNGKKAAPPPVIKKISGTVKKKKGAKRKTTYYLSEEIFANLERIQGDLRAIVPEETRTRISKSQIVNQALTMILQDFKAKGDESRLVRNIMLKI